MMNTARTIASKLRNAMTRKRTNRVSTYNVDEEDTKVRFKNSYSSSNDDTFSVPVNWSRDVGFNNLTSIKNRKTLSTVISHELPEPIKGIFNKVLIDYLLHHKIHDNDDELKEYLSGITIIYLRDIEISPIIIRLLILATKYSSNITTIVLINITLTLELINVFKINETYSITNLILRNIKLPNEDNKEPIIYELIKLIETMKNIEVLDFSGFDICGIYKNHPTSNNKNYTFAKLFNNLILTLSVNLKNLNFTDNIINEIEYNKIFEEHKINNILFEFWDDVDTPTNTCVRIYYTGKRRYRTINLNAYPNFFVDVNHIFKPHINVNADVKNLIENGFINKFASVGGRNSRKKPPTKVIKNIKKAKSVKPIKKNKRNI